jgi:four helix bundle protein
VDEADLKRRTKQFALRCMKLADSLPNKPSGRTIARQLSDCGTAVGANYRAACRARSPAEFVSKLSIVEEEADESGFWLELVMEGGLKAEELVLPLHREADELTRIMTKSVITARASIQNPKSKIQNPKSTHSELTRCASPPPSTSSSPSAAPARSSSPRG